VLVAVPVPVLLPVPEALPVASTGLEESPLYSQTSAIAIVDASVPDKVTVMVVDALERLFPYHVDTRRELPDDVKLLPTSSVQVAPVSETPLTSVIGAEFLNVPILIMRVFPFVGVLAIVTVNVVPEPVDVPREVEELVQPVWP